MKRATGGLMAILLMLASACQSQPAALQPATADVLSAAGLDEIREVIAAETGRADTRLHASAFARSHILVLENAPRRSIEHGVIDARDRAKPLRYHLLSDGRRCFLESQQRDTKAALSHVQCRVSTGD